MTGRQAQERAADAKAVGSDNGIPALEWLLAAIGLVLVVGSIGFLAYRALTADGAPPSIVLTVVERFVAANGHVVRIRAENRGDETAAEVRVEAALGDNGRDERREVTFDYIPAHSVRYGGLFFAADPRGRPIALRALSYREP